MAFNRGSANLRIFRKEMRNIYLRYFRVFFFFWGKKAPQTPQISLISIILFDFKEPWIDAWFDDLATQTDRCRASVDLFMQQLQFVSFRRVSTGNTFHEGFGM